MKAVYTISAPIEDAAEPAAAEEGGSQSPFGSGLGQAPSESGLGQAAGADGGYSPDTAAGRGGGQAVPGSSQDRPDGGQAVPGSAQELSGGGPAAPSPDEGGAAEPGRAGGSVYVYVSSQKVENVTIANGEKSVSHSVRYPYIIDAESLKAGGAIDISLEFEDQAPGSYTIYAYGFNVEAFERAYAKLSAQAMEVTSYSDTSLAGKVTAKEDGLLFMSIPADEGWTALVDGLPAKPETMGGGALMAIRLGRGEHVIELSYKTRGFLPGLLISLAAALTLAASALVGRHGPSPRRAPAAAGAGGYGGYGGNGGDGGAGGRALAKPGSGAKKRRAKISRDEIIDAFRNTNRKGEN
jgi:hypothetical protein